MIIVVVVSLRTFENKTEPLTALILAWGAIAILKGRDAVPRKQGEKKIPKKICVGTMVAWGLSLLEHVNLLRKT